MLHKLCKIAVIVSGIFLIASTSYSFSINGYTLDSSNEITINDGQNHEGTWYDGTLDKGEDNEVEYHAATGQDWDLEGMFFTDNMLFVIGGFDFLNGKDFNNESINIGDLFISTDSNYGTGDQFSTYGYEYVMDFNNSDPTNSGIFNIVTGAYQTYGVTYATDSNPSHYLSDGTTNSTGSYSILSEIGNVEGYFNGNTHNALIFDLDDFVTTTLGGNSELYFHITETCGNDELEGHTAVPEPATMLLFGLGLLGIGAVSRKKLHNL